MDTARISAIGHQLKGAAKAGTGRLLHNAKLTADGEAEEAAGKAQDAAYHAKESATTTRESRSDHTSHHAGGSVFRWFGKCLGYSVLENDGTPGYKPWYMRNVISLARSQTRRMKADPLKRPAN
jgi:uncharacterized protein YjbJ (UPF0337 family)